MIYVSYQTIFIQENKENLALLLILKPSKDLKKQYFT